MLVTAQGGGATRSPSYTGLSRRRPLLAGLMTLFLLSLAGIPPTAGFIAKVSVFGAAIRAGHWSLVLIGVLSSVAAAFFYLRVIVLMYMQEPATSRGHRAGAGRRGPRLAGRRRAPRAGGPDARDRRVPAARRAAGEGLGADVVSARAARWDAPAAARLGRMSRRVIPGLEAPDATLEAESAAASTWSSAELEKSVHVESSGLLTETSSYLIAAGGKRFRADARAPGRLLRRPAAPPADPGLGRDRARPPRHAVPRRRDRRGRRPPRRAQRERALGQHGRHPHRRLPVRARLGDLHRPRHRRLPPARPHDRGALRRPDPRGRQLREGGAARVELPRDHPPQDGVADRARRAGWAGCSPTPPPEHMDILEEFGDALGMAFQLSDDIMDITASQLELGKEPGSTCGGRLHAARSSTPSRTASAGRSWPGSCQHGRPTASCWTGRSRSSAAAARSSTPGRPSRTRSRARSPWRERLPEGPARHALIQLARFLAARCGAEQPA